MRACVRVGILPVGLLALLPVAPALQLGAAWVHEGDARLPPLVELPGSPLPLRYVVKPPSPDALYEWQCERGVTDADPSWASVWPCAAALAGRLVAEPGLVTEKTVVELGSGLGVSGLVAATLGAAAVTLVDREGLALQCAMASAERCGLSTAAVGSDATAGLVRAAAADWGEQDALQGLTADVVLGSEVLYTPSEVPALVRCAARLLRSGGGGGTLLVADPERERAPGCRASLAAEAARLGAEVSTDPLDGGPSTNEAIVLVRVEFPPLSP